MKTILTYAILLTYASISFAQDDESYYCGYVTSHSADQLCNMFRISAFASDQEAVGAVDKILDPLGLKRNFVVESCPDIDNAIAATINGVRYILYDHEFMAQANSENSDWSSLSILAHEVAHHLNGHTLSHERKTPEKKRKQELEADEFSGFVLFKLGATLEQAQMAMMNMSAEFDDTYSSHPSRSKRLAAIQEGFEHAESQSNLKKVIKVKDTDGAEAYFNEGKQLYRDEKYNEAVIKLSFALELNNQYSQAYCYRGDAYNELERYQDAIKDFNKALEYSPDYPWAYNLRGITKKDLKDYVGAIEDYTRAIELSPDYEAPYYNRGYAYRKIDEYDQAILDYTKAIELDPDDAENYNGRAIAYKRNGDYEMAVHDYSMAINLTPDEAYLYNNRGNARTSLDQTDIAMNDYNKAIEIDPDYALAYKNRADLKEDLDDLHGAIDDYNKATQLDPRYTSAYIARGWTYYLLDRYADALSDFNIALNQDPTRDLALNNRGVVKQAMNDLEGACIDYKTACEMGNTTYGCPNYEKICK